MTLTADLCRSFDVVSAELNHILSRIDAARESHTARQHVDHVRRAVARMRDEVHGLLEQLSLVPLEEIEN